MVPIYISEFSGMVPTVLMIPEKNASLLIGPQTTLGNAMVSKVYRSEAQCELCHRVIEVSIGLPSDHRACYVTLPEGHLAPRGSPYTHK